MLKLKSTLESGDFFTPLSQFSDVHQSVASEIVAPEVLEEKMLKSLCLVLCKGLARLGGLSKSDWLLPEIHLPLRDCLCSSCRQDRALQDLETRKVIRARYEERLAAKPLSEPVAPDLKG